jgi:hypothetical protein
MIVAKIMMVVDKITTIVATVLDLHQHDIVVVVVSGE